MPTAVQEVIAQELISRLEQITTANGYGLTVPSVDRVNRDANDWLPKNNSVIVVQGTDEPDQENDHPGNPPANAYQLTFQIKGCVRQSDESSTADQAQENLLAASIKKAVCNSSTWHQFDSQSYNAVWGPTERFSLNEGAYAGTSLTLVVMYRVSETNPFVARS